MNWDSNGNILIANLPSTVEKVMVKKEPGADEVRPWKAKEQRRVNRGIIVQPQGLVWRHSQMGSLQLLLNCNSSYMG